ncbi:MAG: acetylglutamate kinase [Myxococcales bacterium]|nr:acetylglutamate kinase [Myxococcales bacterium]MCZ6715257.1 acetylglutamate kinase [Deltaproteobacteria bacterium]MCZ6822952.1 acetylglutamate kinase [Deltaproteobacteria bacterium]TDI97661.1 MAG: acetylglutamate kinase [Deltaproteobacteria bacterium]TDJ09059.1 MAG: acetylglutamate kinase [Deltaproteobacteria bacterium]
MDRIIEKAHTLVEALPYIRAFYGKTIVIKYGGAAMADAKLKQSFATDVTLLRYIGLSPVIVHGGGPQIAQMLSRLGKESQFVDGMRVTDDETMEIVEMVLGGQVNAEIVANVGQAGGRAVGLTGKDCGLMRVSRRLGSGGQDLGRVGSPEEVDASVLTTMTQNGLIPVIAPIGMDESGQTYNVNGDVMAGKIAQALGAEKLILLTDVEGVLDVDGKLWPRLSADEARAAIADGSVSGGMIPKLECCIDAAAHGVNSAHVIDGRISHALLLEIFTDGGVGTLVRAE